MISRSFAIARIAVPSFVKRRKHAVATVIRKPSTSAITFVHSTRIPATVNVSLSVGNEIERDAPPLEVHNRSITPSRISVSPSVAVALTSGSRLARAGPNTIP